MPKPTEQQQKEGLTNFLRHFDKEEKYFLHPSEEKKVLKFAIAEKGKDTAVILKSNFMTYDEMNCYFYGILAVKEKRYNF